MPFVEVIEVTKNECKWIKGKISVSIGSTKNEGNSLENPSFVKLCVTITDYRTFVDNLNSVIDFIEWYNRHHKHINV